MLLLLPWLFLDFAYVPRGCLILPSLYKLLLVGQELPDCTANKFIAEGKPRAPSRWVRPTLRPKYRDGAYSWAIWSPGAPRKLAVENPAVLILVLGWPGARREERAAANSRLLLVLGRELQLSKLRFCAGFLQTQWLHAALRYIHVP